MVDLMGMVAVHMGARRVLDQRHDGDRGLEGLTQTRHQEGQSVEKKGEEHRGDPPVGDGHTTLPEQAQSPGNRPQPHRPGWSLQAEGLEVEGNKVLEWRTSRRGVALTQEEPARPLAAPEFDGEVPVSSLDG